MILPDTRKKKIVSSIYLKKRLWNINIMLLKQWLVVWIMKQTIFFKQFTFRNKSLQSILFENTPKCDFWLIFAIINIAIVVQNYIWANYQSTSLFGIPCSKNKHMYHTIKCYLKNIKSEAISVQVKKREKLGLWALKHLCSQLTIPN